MIGWALRWAVVWGGIAFLCVALIDRGTEVFTPPAVVDHRIAERTEVPPVDSLTYPVDAHGHVVVEAEIDGAPLRLLVDTGASLVSLTLADARAAGIETGRLAFSGRALTANGPVRLAPVNLRWIRVGQLSVDNVPAAVLEHLNVSLLGMSFLSRLRSYRMSDGRFTLTW